MGEPRRNLAQACPDAETIAAYLDGRLTGPAKTAVTEHLTSCDDCYGLFAESARTVAEMPQSAPAPVRAWRVISSAPAWGKAAMVAGLAAAASLTLVVQPQLASSIASLFGRSDVAELVAAVGTERHFEPRLTGGFAYAVVTPPPTVRSGEASEDRVPADVRIASLKLEQRLKANRTAANLRAYAAAQLVVGRSDKAVSSLEEAARMTPRDSRLQSDLAAAYLVRFTDKNNLEDVTRAVGAATEATEGDPKLREARFNLALALESLSLREEARKAWQAYLAIDSSSPWAAEARQHLDALAPEKQSKRFEQEHQQVVDAAASGDPTRALTVAKRLPDTAYDYVENELIPMWADAWVAGDRAKADDALRRARVMSDAIAAAVNERMPADTVTAIERAVANSPSHVDTLARAHQTFRDARVRYESADIAEAANRFAEADAAFSAAGSAFAEWTTLYGSIAEYYQGRPTAAARPLDRLIDVAAQRNHRTVRGRAFRMRGLVRGVTGDLAGSLDDYHAAWVEFDRLGARQDVAAIHIALAERYDTLGETTLAWHHESEALQRLSDVRLDVTRHTILLFANIKAVHAGALVAALAFESELLARARERSPAADVAELYLRRANTYHELGNAVQAEADIEEAIRWAARIGDANLARRWRAEAQLTRGELSAGRTFDASAALRASLSYFQAAGMSQRLARVYLAIGTTELAAGRRQDAAAAFQSGIEIIERQRARLPSGQLRLSYFDQPWQLYDAAVDLLTSAPESRDEALRVAERARARDLREATAAHSIDDPAAVASTLDDNQALLFYEVLPERLIAWTITHDRTTFAASIIRRDELTQAVGDLVLAIRERRQNDVDRQAERLFGAIIEPFTRGVAASTRLIIVPHGILHSVPFAALRDPHTKRYLIEDHALVVAPSATVFARAAARLRSTRPLQTASVFVIANPLASDVDGTRPLPSAEREGRDIQALFPQTRLMSGAAATKDAFLSFAGNFDIVHFAGHAIANDTYPPLSRLLLARDAAGRPGTLFGDELQSAPLDRPALVVLAACSTAVGAIKEQEGAINLARPFLARGVPVVIASLWDVDDAASEALFQRFYVAVRAGASPSAALRDAQLALLHHTDGTLRETAAWAGFVHFGGDFSNGVNHSS